MLLIKVLRDGIKVIILKIKNIDSDYVIPKVLMTILTLLLASLVIFIFIQVSSVRVEGNTRCDAGYLRFADTKQQVISDTGVGIKCEG